MKPPFSYEFSHDSPIFQGISASLPALTQDAASYYQGLVTASSERTDEAAKKDSGERIRWRGPGGARGCQGYEYPQY